MAAGTMGTAVSLRERKKQRTRAQLAQSTVDLVAEHGLAAVRAEDICAAVEVGRATFFRYFDSKERAFVEGVHQRRLAAVLTEIAARPDSEPPFDALREALLATCTTWRRDRDALVLEARIRTDSPTVQAWAAATHHEWVGAVASAIAPRFADGGRDATRPVLLAGAAMAAVRVSTELWLATNGRRSPVPLVTRAFDDLRRLAER